MRLSCRSHPRVQIESSVTITAYGLKISGEKMTAEVPRGRGSQPIAEDVAVAALFDMAAKAILELGAVEGGLLELLLGGRERLDVQHHEGMAAAITRDHAGKVAVERVALGELEDALQPHGARDRGVVVVGVVRQARVGGPAV